MITASPHLPELANIQKYEEAPNDVVKVPFLIWIYEYLLNEIVYQNEQHTAEKCE